MIDQNAVLSQENSAWTGADATWRRHATSSYIKCPVDDFWGDQKSVIRKHELKTEQSRVVLLPAKSLEAVLCSESVRTWWSETTGVSNHQVWLDITRKGLWTDRNVCKGFCFTDSITGSSAFSSSEIRSAPHVLWGQALISGSPTLALLLDECREAPRSPISGVFQCTWATESSEVQRQHKGSRDFKCVPHGKDRAGVDGWIWLQVSGVVALETNAC